MTASLKSIVEELAGKTDFQRRHYILDRLYGLELPFGVQDFASGRELVKDRSNLMLDIPVNAHRQKRLLISSHYDAVLGSPGANDNASAVAVVWALAEKYHSTPPPLPLRLVFFDCEEDSLQGSRRYVQQRGVKDISMVLNLEMVGDGSIPLFWPATVQSTEYKNILSRAAGHEAYFLPYQHQHSGDHQSFLDAGILDSICLTLAHEDDTERIRSLARRLEQPPSVMNTRRIIRKVESSRTFEHYHNAEDKSEHIREESLQQALGIVVNTIDCYGKIFQSDQQKVQNFPQALSVL